MPKINHGTPSDMVRSFLLCAFTMLIDFAGLVLMYIGFGLVFSSIYLVYITQENKRRDAGLRDEVIKGVEGGDEKNGVYDSVADAKREKGDKWSGYRYTV